MNVLKIIRELGHVSTLDLGIAMFPAMLGGLIIKSSHKYSLVEIDLLAISIIVYVIVFIYLTLRIAAKYYSFIINNIVTLFLLIINPIFVIRLFSEIYTTFGLIDNGNLVHDINTSYYFSIVTWTTLGYGDIKPTQDVRLFAAFEAVMGYLYMGLLIGVFFILFQRESNK